MYQVQKTGEQFKNFLAACNAAEAVKSEVFEIATGLRRWAPAESVSAKKMRIYKEKMNAWKAQQEMLKSH